MIRALAIALLLSGAAQAEPIKRKGMLPPPQYDVPYVGVLHIYRTNDLTENMKAWDMLHREVNNAPAFNGAVAFAIHKYGACHVFMLNDTELTARGMNIDLTWRHELAHCNGWGPSHPDGTWVLDAPPPTFPINTFTRTLADYQHVLDVEKKNRGILSAYDKYALERMIKDSERPLLDPPKPEKAVLKKSDPVGAVYAKQDNTQAALSVFWLLLTVIGVFTVVRWITSSLEALERWWSAICRDRYMRRALNAKLVEINES